MSKLLGNKIMLIGCSGSGKSTLAIKLHEKLKLPLYHLDKVYWLPNWVKVEKEEFLKKQKEIAERNEWIMDGNFTSSLDIRLKHADTVLLFDFDSNICISRVLKRWEKHKGRARPDMHEGCIETEDNEFLDFIKNFNETKRPIIMETLKKYPKPNLIILKNPEEVEEFLNNI